ncbi:hypothetical protein RFI_12640, partial [Reticulomyxa filosa]
KKKKSGKKKKKKKKKIHVLKIPLEDVMDTWQREDEYKMEQKTSPKQPFLKEEMQRWDEIDPTQLRIYIRMLARNPLGTRTVMPMTKFVCKGSRWKVEYSHESPDALEDYDGNTRNCTCCDAKTNEKKVIEIQKHNGKIISQQYGALSIDSINPFSSNMHGDIRFLSYTMERIAALAVAGLTLLISAILSGFNTIKNQYYRNDTIDKDECPEGLWIYNILQFVSIPLFVVSFTIQVLEFNKTSWFGSILAFINRLAFDFSSTVLASTYLLSVVYVLSTSKKCENYTSFAHLKDKRELVYDNIIVGLVGFLLLLIPTASIVNRYLLHFSHTTLNSAKRVWSGLTPSEEDSQRFFGKCLNNKKDMCINHIVQEDKALTLIIKPNTNNNKISFTKKKIFPIEKKIFLFCK